MLNMDLKIFIYFPDIKAKLLKIILRISLLIGILILLTKYSDNTMTGGRLKILGNI